MTWDILDRAGVRSQARMVASSCAKRSIRRGDGGSERDFMRAIWHLQHGSKSRSSGTHLSPELGGQATARSSSAYARDRGRLRLGPIVSAPGSRLRHSEVLVTSGPRPEKAVAPSLLDGKLRSAFR